LLERADADHLEGRYAQAGELMGEELEVELEAVAHEHRATQVVNDRAGDVAEPRCEQDIRARDAVELACAHRSLRVDQRRELRDPRCPCG
jgi:hypothetical protein